MKKSVIIPPYIWHFVLGLAGLLVGLYLGAPLSEERAREYSMKIYELQIFYDRKFLVFAGVLALLAGSIHYSIHEKYIMVHFLFIPVRIIRWDKVSTAKYLYRWGNTDKTAQGLDAAKLTGQGIIVTLKGCPPYVPELDGLNMFTFHHPIKSFFIQFTPRHQKKYVKIFQSYFPDLTFQFGYEKNFEKGLPYDPVDL